MPGEEDTSFVPVLEPQLATPCLPSWITLKVNPRFLAALPPAGNLLQHPTSKFKPQPSRSPCDSRVTPGRTLSTRNPGPTHPAPRLGVNTRPRTWPPQRSPCCRAGAGRAGTCGRPVDHSAAAFVWPSARNGLFPFSLFKVKTRPFRPFLPPEQGPGRVAAGLLPGAVGRKPARAGQASAGMLGTRPPCSSAPTGTFRWGFWAPTRRGIFGK